MKKTILTTAFLFFSTFIHPENNPLIEKAEKLISAKKYDAAIELLAGETGKKETDIHRYYIRAHVGGGKYDEIKEKYIKYAGENRNDPFYLYMLGYVDYYSGSATKDINKIKTSLSIFRKVLELDKDFIYCRYTVGMIYMYNLGKPDYDAALREFKNIEDIYKNKKIKEDKTCADVMEQTAKIHEQKSDYDSAIIYYKKTLNIRKQAGDTRGEADCINSLGAIASRISENKTRDFKEIVLRGNEAATSELPDGRSVADKGDDYYAINEKYGVQNLFDGNIATAWVEGEQGCGIGQAIFMSLPDECSIINIFNGYGKSESVFKNNGRVKKLKLTCFAAVNPQGHVTEIAEVYKSKQFPKEYFIDLEDKFILQSFEFPFKSKELKEFQDKFVTDYKKLSDTPISSVKTILKLELVDVYKGAKFEDTCISEISFSNKFPLDTKPVK